VAVLEELSTAARQVAQRLGPATVAIGRGGRGSGLVVAPNRVLTNAHNLRDRTTTVTFADGRVAPASVLGLDGDGDLTVLDVDTADAPAVEFGTATPDAGDVVFGVGRAGGRLRVTFGLVTAADAAFRGPRGRLLRGAVEHSAPLARGSSGGALADADGRVVAINTHRAGPGFYAARPADADLRTLVERLAAGESVERPTLGVALAPAHVARRLRRAVGLPERDGLLVRRVASDSAAARAGVLDGDLLVRVGDADLTSVDALHDALDAAGDGGTLSLRIVRGTEEHEVVVSFAADATAHEGTA
jgi:serine protease Do